MKRLGRILHRLLTALSLLLLLATAGVWVRSYWVSDSLTWYEWLENRLFYNDKSIWCSRGGIQFHVERLSSASIHSGGDAQFRHIRQLATDYPAYGNQLIQYFPSGPQRYAALGFEWIPQTTTKSFGVEVCVLKSLTLPLYFPTLLFAILPAHFILRLRRRRRIARRLTLGLCQSCGYDLRASTGRCPECGAPAPALPSPH